MTDETTPQDSAAMSPASAGSHGQPVAWLIHADGWQMVSLFREHADAAADENDAEVSPLYRRPTLTDEERTALRKVLRRVREDYFAGRFADSVEVAAVIDGLLERTH